MGIPTTTNASITPDFQALAELGFSCFIVPRGEKRPVIDWKKYQSQHPSPAELDSWQGTASNVAIVTGKLSNLLVLDVDNDEAQALVESWDLPETVSAKTSRGTHLYFRYPNREIKTNAAILGCTGLDVRAEGGIIIGPGSLHHSGAMYRWENSPGQFEIAELPSRVVSMLAEKPSPKSVSVSKPVSEFVEAGELSVWLNREIQTRIAEFREAKEGERNDSLFRVSVSLANHVAALNVQWSDVERLLWSEALAMGLTAEETQATLQSAWKTGQKNPTEWLLIATEWIYVASSDRFMHPATRRELSPQAFSRQFADKYPYERGNFATLLTSTGLIRKVLDLTFFPKTSSGVVELKGQPFFNTYSDPNIEAETGDWTPLTEFLEYLVPNNAERHHLVQMIAWTVANPGEKLSHALLLQSKDHGIGKTTLIDIWRALIGPENTRLTNSEEMDSPYQPYLENSLLTVLEELNLGRGMSVYNRLKALITAPTAVVNLKYRQQREVPNFTNFVFLSNLDTPIFIEKADRRFFVIESPAKRRGKEYWIEFQQWWRANLGTIKAYFDNVELGDFGPKGTPPMTAAKERLIRASELPLTQNLRELIDEMQSPLREVCTLDDIRAALSKGRVRVETPQKLTQALKELGCKPLGQHRIGRVRRSLWALVNADYWMDADTTELSNAYLGLSEKGPDSLEAA